MKECHVRKGVFDFERDLRGCEMIEFLAGKRFLMLFGTSKTTTCCAPHKSTGAKGFLDASAKRG